ncbi:winged helix-turn-helix domain-containing protein [Listeria monocytogenes]|uniref:ArsR/SmtB family transcription factor n=1 Tax=Listeria monocytogenes TaxID=1639 RepID=UPI000873E07D|nr:winged helix-turn-helix domain-containing protein [Listeria monocytogenes]EAC7182558.1 ArsR family transcriptional regulator [Listeria monocytogenes]EAC8000828.1 ArsR family transcriptional regulator [Listeria monocytogenes]EAC8350986.1 ArsR family transcriptional regulator [Listeria monocytogenes]EAD4096259.1 ArsR family transcriptional regulator [Listeria monocytogenes]EAD9140590.1 ArsR family transcriptional regulator [Listeria monocytogenes]
MNETPDVSNFIKIIKDNSRQLILDTLMDGRFHTVYELAKSANITHHTASYHLKKLYDLNWVVVEKHGRHRYYQLKNKEVAVIFEYLTSFSPAKPINYLSKKIKQEKLHFARTCYDHLAGYIGVQINNRLLECGYLEEFNNKWVITGLGQKFFKDALDIKTAKLEHEKRQFCRVCLDWSERRHHLAGSIGKAMLESFIKKRFVILEDDSRAVLITKKGKLFLKETLQIDL